MTDRTKIHGLEVDTALKRFLDEQVLPAVGVDGAKFWQASTPSCATCRRRTRRCWPSVTVFRASSNSCNTACLD